MDQRLARSQLDGGRDDAWSLRSTFRSELISTLEYDLLP